LAKEEKEKEAKEKKEKEAKEMVEKEENGDQEEKIIGYGDGEGGEVE
jgi:hypothetical protein